MSPISIVLLFLLILISLCVFLGFVFGVDTDDEDKKHPVLKKIKAIVSVIIYPAGIISAAVCVLTLFSLFKKILFNWAILNNATSASRNALAIFVFTNIVVYIVGTAIVFAIFVVTIIAWTDAHSSEENRDVFCWLSIAGSVEIPVLAGLIANSCILFLCFLAIPAALFATIYFIRKYNPQ